MPEPLLLTKLYIPQPRPGMVLRPRLVGRLNEGLASGRNLALISAPAGFGKTTLVSEWVAGGGRPGQPKVRTAWLSLDEGDNDPVRFLTYLIAALQTLSPETGGSPTPGGPPEDGEAEIGKGVLAVLQSPQPPPVEAMLTILLNEIAGFSADFILVLDDYHAIDSQAVDQALIFLVEHLPPQMHLVIASREDPPLPLARLRARDQLTELRAADLRFSPAEAADFLNRKMGLKLSEGEVAALDARTEGWIAGLQLAALSMQGREDIAGFIQAFTGSHGTGFRRFILDYLVEEVLRRQPEPIRAFLLQTAVLDRFCAQLCDAVTEREDSRHILDVLERGNLFLIPLDDYASTAEAHHWYRYHHLFAEVLRTYLCEEQPNRAPVLHQRASVWFEQNDLPADAIRYALAAKEYERAADLIERVWLSMDLNYQSAAWLGWARELPDELVRARPVLSVGYAWALLGVGELEASEARLRDGECWLKPADEQAGQPSARMVVVDEAEFRSLPASIAAARAYRALALEDIAATKMYARQALELVTENEIIHRTQAMALLGLAEYAGGDLRAAEQDLLKFQTMMWQANDSASAIGITFILANIKQVEGRLLEAIRAYRQSLQLAVSRDAPAVLGLSDLYRGLSELLCEQGDLEGAAQHLLKAQQLGEKGTLTGWPQRLCVARARMKVAQGDLDGALELLEEAERLYVRNPLPERPVAALKAQVLSRQGRLPEALAWVSDQNLSPVDDLSYMREFEHLTLARVLIARAKINQVEGDLPAAMDLLERLLRAAEDGGRNGSVIEILVLQSLAQQAQGDQPRALAVLERALSQAEPQGYVHI